MNQSSRLPPLAALDHPRFAPASTIGWLAPREPVFLERVRKTLAVPSRCFGVGT